MNEQTKIGIGIVHCITKSNGAGYDVVYKTDDGIWSTLIDDTGDVFRHIKVNNGAIIRMIKFTADGWYLCSMKQIAGRDGEYRASWIFFPSDIHVEAKDIKNILEETELNITRREYDVDAINNIVAKYTNYISGSPKYTITPSSKGYAIRYVDGENPSLFDIFGKIYQKEFARFSWVIMMKKEDVDIKDETVVNITSLPLLSSKIIQPLSDEQFGFQAYVDNRLFTFPQRISGNETIKIVWMRNGFANVVKNGTCQEQLSLKEDDLYRIIYWSQIRVRDQFDRPLRVSSTVRINIGESDERNRCWFVPEKRISEVIISVDARGYEPNPIDRIDLGQKAVNEDIIIRLKEEAHTYKFRIRNSDGNIEFTRTFNTKITDTYIPLEGYKMRKPIIEANQGFIDLTFDWNNYQRIYQGVPANSGNSNKKNGKRPSDKNPHPKGEYREYPTSGPKHRHPFDWMLILKGALLGVLIFAIIFGIYWFFIREDNSTYSDYNSSNEQMQTISEDYTQGQAKDYREAIEYLEQKAKYKRDEMESTEGLAGLWDMLNSYDFPGIIRFADQTPDLKQSQRFNDIIQIISRDPKISGKFCQDNDYEITVSNYINKLNRVLNTNESSNSHNPNNPSSVNNSGRQSGHSSGNNTGKGTSKTNDNSQTSSDNS